MSSISSTYLELCQSLQTYDKLTNQLQYTLISGTEGAMSSLIDTVIRFLKALKYHISSLVKRFIRFIAQLISYNNYITARNLSRAKKITSIYKKCDAATKIKVDEAFAKTAMSDCWSKETFDTLITDFGDMCIFGYKDMVEALQTDINNVTNPGALNNSNINKKLAEFQNRYGLAYQNGGNFAMIMKKYPSITNATFAELNFADMSTIVTLVETYEKSLEEYRKLVKVPNTLDRLEYELDRTIRDVKQDPLIAANVKEQMKDITKVLNDNIKSVKNYLDTINKISQSINTRISAMLAKCREILEKRKELKDSTEDFSVLQETVIVVTSDENFNKKMKAWQTARATLMELQGSELYKHLNIGYAKTSTPNDEVKAFCKGDSASAPAMMNIDYKTYIDPNNKDTIQEFLEDANRVIKDTGLIVRIDEDGHLYFMEDTHIPDMSIALAHANILTIM